MTDNDNATNPWAAGYPISSELYDSEFDIGWLAEHVNKLLIEAIIKWEEVEK